MITLDNDTLEFRFPAYARNAGFAVDFQRTLRIPDSDKTYPLPPGLGRFPVRHVEDYPDLPHRTREHGGVMLPMWQAEALWLNFNTRGPTGAFPVAVKIAAGKINAVTGETWRSGLHRDPQDYCVCPGQPWLDGFCVEKGVIRQFVAMPLGQGYSAEEQITGAAEWGGLQIAVTPLKVEPWTRWRKEREKAAARLRRFLAPPMPSEPHASRPCCLRESADMGLAAGGRMRQEIMADRFPFADWDQEATLRVFVSIFDSQSWRRITGEMPPHRPPTAQDYANAGLPWFNWYGEGEAVEGSPVLGKVKSVAAMVKSKAGIELPENEDLEVGPILKLGAKKARPVKCGTFGDRARD